MATDPAAAIGTHTITLPSRGALYEGPLKDNGGQVVIRVMTAQEQAILFSQGSSEDRITKIIANTCSLPKGFGVADLLTVDRMAILLAVRTYTFGPKYEFAYSCRYCKANQKHTCDIVQDLNEVLKDDLAEPFEFKLPDSGKVLRMRFMRGFDEEAVQKYAKRMAMQSADASDPSALHRQARLIVDIDGEKTDVVKREAFVKALTARDSVIIDNELDAREPGIDLTIYVECRKCQGLNDMKMPFELEFFRPSALRA